MAQGTFTTPIYLFASIGEGTGKTSLIANIALYLNAKGQRVAIIDGPSEKPTLLQSAFPRNITIETYADLGELQTSRQSRFRRTFFFTNTERISIFPAHRLVTTASIVSDAGLRDFLLQARSKFDLLIVNLKAGSEALDDIEAFTGHNFSRLGAKPLVVLVSNSDLKSLVAFDALLRSRPSMTHLLRERLVVVFNRVPRGPEARGVENQGRTNPSLTLSEIRQLFPLPAAIGIPVLDDLSKQIFETQPAVLIENSPVRQAIAGLVRYLADRYDAPTPWELPSDPEGWSYKVDESILQSLGKHVERLQTIVSRLLFIPQNSVQVYIESAERKVRIRVRLARSLRPNFPPMLNIDYQRPRRMQTPSDVVTLFEGFYTDIDVRSTYRERLETFPRITAKPLYHFDEHFDLQTDFEPIMNWSYKLQHPLADKSGPEIIDTLSIARESFCKWGFRIYQTEKIPGITHFFVPPEFDLSVEFECRGLQLWLAELKTWQRNLTGVRPKAEPIFKPIERTLTLEGDLPDLFNRSWNLSCAGRRHEFPKPLFKERFETIRRTFHELCCRLRFFVPSALLFSTRAEGLPEVPAMQIQRVLVLRVQAPILHCHRGYFTEQNVCHDQKLDVASLRMPKNLPKTTTIGSLLVPALEMIYRSTTGWFFFGAIPAQMLTGTLIANVTHIKQNRPSSEPSIKSDYVQEFTRRGLASGLQCTLVYKHKTLQESLTPYPPKCEALPQKFSMRPVLINYSFSLTHLSDQELYWDLINPTKVQKEVDFTKAFQKITPNHRFIEKQFSANTPSLASLPRLSFEYREFLWHFRNLNFRGFTISRSNRFSLFPAKIGNEEKPKISGLPRWFKESFLVVDPKPLGKRLSLCILPHTLWLDPPVEPSLSLWWRHNRQTTIKTTTPSIRNLVFADISIPTPEISTDIYWQDEEQLYRNNLKSAYFSGFPNVQISSLQKAGHTEQRSVRLSFRYRLYTGSLNLQQPNEFDFSQPRNLLIYPPPKLQTSNYVPIEAWFHIASKTFTIIAFHAVTFHVFTQTKTLAIPVDALSIGIDWHLDNALKSTKLWGKLEIPVIRIRHPGAPWLGSNRPPLFLRSHDSSNIQKQTKTLQIEFPQNIDFPVIELVRPDMGMAKYALPELPLRLRKMNVCFIIPERYMPISPPDVIDVLYNNLHERWRQSLERKLAYPASLTRAQLKNLLWAAHLNKPSILRPIPDMLSRSPSMSSKIELLANRNMAILTPRLIDLLSKARQWIESKYKNEQFTVK